MSERKRMSRAKVAANPQREVFRGASASLWFVDDPLPAEPRPSSQASAEAPPFTMEAFEAAVAMLRDNRVALPRTIAMSPSLYEELQRFGVADRYDDQTDAVGFAWQAMARERERARLRAAQYEREAPWRARILASIPAPRHITAAELRARVVLPTLRERLGLAS